MDALPKIAGLINPLRSEPAERFGRTIDRIPPSNGGPGGGGGSFDGEWPLKLVKVDDANVKVLLGTVNGFIPANINTNLDLSGTDGTWVIYMIASISGTSVTAAYVDGAPSGVVPTDDSTTSYRLIGEVDVASSIITDVRPSMAWSQNVSVCTADTPPYYWTTGA